MALLCVPHPADPPPRWHLPGRSSHEPWGLGGLGGPVLTLPRFCEVWFREQLKSDMIQNANCDHEDYKINECTLQFAYTW